jgi:hypothetical protein
MNRREALSAVAVLFGGTIIGAEAFLTGCKTTSKKEGLFAAEDIAFLDEVGETILPATAASPGAKEAKIGEFMKIMVTDCYTEDDQEIFTQGIKKLNEASEKKYDKEFMKLAANQRHDLLVQLDAEAKNYVKNKKDGDANHYFSMLKQLTLWGYFTSEPGATKALRYLPVPGKYEGCVPYKKGEKAWALS